LVIKFSNLNWKDLFPKKDEKKQKIDFLSLLLGIFISLPLLILLVVGLQTPPNNLDSLHTHLPRIYYWLQHASLSIWPATDKAQFVYPINANLQGLWLFLFSQNEFLFFLVSWFSLIIIVMSVYQIARLLRFTRHQAMISCLVVLSIPVALLQVYSFQMDLAATAALMVTIYLLTSYINNRSKPKLILSMLMLAISLGIKQTAFFTLPALSIWILYSIIVKRFERKHLLYLLLLPVFFFLFSSFQYIQNLVNYKSFFGVQDVFYGQNMSAGNLIEKASYNIPRFAYNFLSVDGLGQNAANALTSIKETAFKATFSLFQLNLENEVFLQPGYDPGERFRYATIQPLTEETTWFGPLSVTLTLISFFLIFFQKDPQRKEYLLFSIFLFGSFFIAIIFQRLGWDPYQGRYFLLAFIPFMPIIGICLPSKKFYKSIFTFLISACFLALTLVTCTMNLSKPIFTESTAVNIQNECLLRLTNNNFIENSFKHVIINIPNTLFKKLPQRQSILSIPYYDQMFFSSNSNLIDFNMVNTFLPAHEPLYLKISVSIIEYPLFGINITRNLYPITDAQETPVNGYLLVENDSYAGLENFHLVTSNDTYSLIQRTK